MKVSSIVAILCLLSLSLTISEFDFNSCRISNCNSEELNCVSEEKGCLDYFGAMRAWYFNTYLVLLHAQIPMKTSTLAGIPAGIQQLGPTPTGSVYHIAMKMSAMLMKSGLPFHSYFSSCCPFYDFEQYHYLHSIFKIFTLIYNNISIQTTDNEASE